MQISFIICGMVSGIILFQSVLIAPAINKLIDQKQASTLLRHLWPKFFLTIGLLSLLSFVTSLLFPTDQILTKYSSSLSFVLMSICYFMVPIINNAKDSSKKYDYINIECSSKENTNIDETFDLIINQIIKHKNIDLSIKDNLEIEEHEKYTKINCCTIL